MPPALCWAQVMGSEPDPQRPFYVPYAALRSERQAPRPGVQAPFIECILAAAEDSESARLAAARALAGRLLELKAGGQLQLGRGGPALPGFHHLPGL